MSIFGWLIAAFVAYQAYKLWNSKLITGSIKKDYEIDNNFSEQYSDLLNITCSQNDNTNL